MGHFDGKFWWAILLGHMVGVLYPRKVLTDDVLDKYLESCSDDEMQIISIRKDHHESSAANRIAEAYFHKLKRSQNTNIKIFLYSLSNADDVCPKSLLSSR